MRKDIGAETGWLCWERVRRTMGSGRCVGGWVGGVGGGTRGERRTLGDDGGGNIGSVMVIANGDALGVTTGVAVGHNLE